MKGEQTFFRGSGIRGFLDTRDYNTDVVARGDDASVKGLGRKLSNSINTAKKMG